MKLITSSSPHIRSGETTRRVMGTVLLALLPTLLAGVWFFGPRALLLVLVTVAACVASEWVFLAVTRGPGSVLDGSAAVTGLLLALTLPATTLPPIHLSVSAHQGSHFLYSFQWKRRLRQRLHCNGHQFHGVIICGYAVGTQMSASAAAVYDCPLSVFSDPHAHGIHNAAAVCLSVPRLNV